MSNIHRTLVLNPVEPAPVSMKFRSNLDTIIDVEYLRQNGAPYNTDFGAQLYLISRSTGQVQQYLLPATDVVNGKARAYVPAGDVGDANGYNVQIIGTVEGDPRLIARGSASVIETEALGIIPTDLIDSIDITLAYGDDASIDVTLWQDVGKTTPYNVMPPPVSANVWTRMGGTVLTPFTVTQIAPNVVRLSLSEGQIDGLPGSCWWSLSVSGAGGLTTLAQGNVLVTGTPLPSFTSVDINYTYVKQATLVAPNSGQAIHCNNALDVLRFSMYDNVGADQSQYLSRMSLSGTITLLTPPASDPDKPPDPLPTLVLPRDAPRATPPDVTPIGTTWNIVSVDDVSSAGYWQFVVTPNTQAPETGLQKFTFIRG